MKHSTTFHHIIHTIITALVIYAVSTYPMDQETQAIKDNTVTIFELMLNHGSIFNHHLVCALALVNKYSNKHVKDTAHIRKQYFLDHSTYHIDQPLLVWHTHGTAYAYVFFKTKLCMRYHYLLNNKIFHCNEFDWDNNPSPLLGETNIFFDHQGNACFHATGMIDVLGRGKQREVIEYAITSKGKDKQTRCVLGIKNNKGELVSISLAQFAKHSFIDLTQAVLHSRTIYKLSTPWHKDTVKIFHWDGVAIPQRYCNPEEKQTMADNFKTLLEKIYSNERAAKN